MFQLLIFVHVFTLLNICACSATEDEVKTGFKEHVYLKLKRFKSDEDELITLGNKLCKEKKYSEAIRAFDDAILVFSEKRERSYQFRGKCYAKMGKMEMAISNFQKAVVHQGYGSDESRRLLANALFDTEKYDEAIEQMLRVSQEESVALAYKLCSMGKTDKAMDAYKKLIIKYPNMESYTARGNCYTRMESINEALSDFQKAVDLDHSLSQEQKPGYSRVLLCFALFSVGKMNREELSNLDDVQLRALAFKLLDGERFEDGIHCLSAAIEKYPKNAEFFKDRAVFYSRKNDYESAISDYKRAVELDPSSVHYKLDLAEALVDGGNYTEAKQNLETLETSLANDVLQRLRDKIRNIREKLYLKMETA